MRGIDFFTSEFVTFVVEFQWELLHGYDFWLLEGDRNGLNIRVTRVTIILATIISESVENVRMKKEPR